MEASPLGTPFQGLGPGGISSKTLPSALGFPSKKVPTLEYFIHEAKVRGGHSHGGIGGSPMLPPGPSRQQHPGSTFSEHVPQI